MGQLVVAQTYDLEVARGLVAGVTRKTLNGYNAAVGVTQEPIWAESGAQYLGRLRHKRLLLAQVMLMTRRQVQERRLFQ